MIYLCHNYLYNKMYEKTISMLSMSKRIFKLSKSKKKQTYFLFKRLQKQMEQINNWILERKKNSFLQKAKQTNRFRSKSKLEGWEKIRQGWLCFDNVQRTSKQGYRWLCKGTQINYGTNYRKVFTS